MPNKLVCCPQGKFIHIYQSTHLISLRCTECKQIKVVELQPATSCITKSHASKAEQAAKAAASCTNQIHTMDLRELRKRS